MSLFKAKRFDLVDRVQMDASITPAVPFEMTEVAGPLSVTAEWSNTGTPNGTFVVEVSNEKGGEGGSGISKWFDISASISPALPNASAATEFSIDFARLGYKWLRIRYVRSSGGTGAYLTVRVFANTVS